MENKNYVVKIVPKQIIIDKFSKTWEKEEQSFNKKLQEDFQIYLNYYSNLIEKQLISNGRVRYFEIQTNNKELDKLLYFGYKWRTALEAINILLEEYRKEEYIVTEEVFSKSYHIKLRFWISAK